MKVLKIFFVVWTSFFVLFFSATESYSFTIDASAGPGGSISPSGPVTVSAGAAQTFTITPDPDNRVSDILVGGVSEGPTLSYTFTNVSADQSIEALFSTCDYLFPILLDGHGYYDSLMTAYDDAFVSGLSNITLMLMGGSLPVENVYFDANILVRLKGGYDCSFLDNPGVTSIPGSLTIAAGTVIPEYVTVSSNTCVPTGNEICDGLDNNCNGQIDEGLSTDADGDGHYTYGSCLTPNDDCDDLDADNFPGNTEVCDGFDNNCDGQVDEGLSFIDTDGDGYSAIGSCGGTANDCNDLDYDINPGATEILGDGIDQNCDGQDLIYAYEYIGNFSCLGCHGIDANVLNNQLHQSVAATDVTCAGCHAAKVSAVLPGHYGETVRTTTPENNMVAGETITCISCHDYHDPAEPVQAIIDAGNPGIVWSKVAGTWVGWPTNAYVSLTCDTCHESRAAKHETETAHDNRLIDSDCGQCHTSDTTILGSSGTGTLVTAGDVDILHRTDCTLCHNYTGTKLDAGVVAQEIKFGMAGTPIICTDCHLDKGPLHANTDHDALGYVTTETLCAGCHDPGTDTNGTVRVIHNGTCFLCHETPLPSLQTGIPAGGGDCTTCHTDGFEGHTHSHASSVAVPSNTTDPNTLNCLTSGCHIATSSPFVGAGEVHAAGTYAAGGCATCHTPTTGALLSDTAGDATGTTGECSNCHAVFAEHQSHTPTTHAVSMGTDQSNGLSCNTSGCHNSFTDTWDGGNGIYALHTSSCVICHDSTRNNSDGNVAAEIQEGAATCLECHAGKSAEHGAHPATAFSWDGNCADCHGAGAGAEQVVSDIHKGICSTCHDTSSTSANRDNEMVGASANGVDGDATQANGIALAAESDINAWNIPTCTTCHPSATYSWTDIHTDTATAVDHSTTVTNADTTCTGCHDATAGGTAPDAISSPFIGSGEVHNSGTCANCHTADGSLHAAPALAPSLSATGGNCSACHDDAGVSYFENHTHSHASSVAVPSNTTDPNTLNCLTSGCHTATSSPFVGAGEVHAAGTYAAGGCATCHTPTTGALLSDTAGDATGTTGECSNCHAVFAEHQSHTPTTHAVSMGTDQSNGASCNASGCHGSFTDTWDGVNGIYALHTSSCVKCHDSTRNDSDGNVAAEIQEGAATCLECHAGKSAEHGLHPATAFSWDGNCADCHGAGAGAEQVVSDIHKGICSTCHDTSSTPANRDNEMVGASANGVDGDATQANGTALAAESDINAWNSPTCTTCHPSATYSWTDIHTDTATAVDHSTSVAALASCTTSCHETTGGNIQIAVDGTSGNEVHDSCASCHTSTGALDTSKNGTGIVLGTMGSGDCSQCHTANYFDSHTHSHAVSYNASVDTSQTTQQGCATCHDDNSGALTSWADIYVEHLSNCANCHSYDGSASAPLNDVQNAISSGNPATCATCHTDKVPSTDHGVDHVASGYVTIEAGCAVCHPDPATTFTSNSNNKVHDGCTTCHDGTTNALIGSAAGHENGPNVCTTCHTSRVWTDHNIDHQASGYVTLHSECTSCHSTTMTAGQGFINPADDEKHNGCTSCHAADGSQATGSGDCSMCHSGVTGDWTTHVQDHTAKVTSAAGCASCHSATVDYASFVDGANNLKHDDCYVCHNAGTKLASATAGDCSQCHSGVVGDFTTHTTQDHTTKVTSAAGCTSCHSATVDYVNFVDPANSLKHDNCTTCHDGTTNAPTATAGDCSQCHSGITGDFTTHTTQDHTTKVTLQAECVGCHTETVDYANFTDGANDKKHDSCTTCHNATTNAPIASAGDCSQCHTANYFDSHTHSHAVSYNASVDTSQTTQQGCATCHDDNSGGLGSWADIYVEHLSNCANCHSYDGSASAPLNDVQNAISSGNPATCATCHTDKVPSTDHGVDHVASGYVTIEAGCAVCHPDPATTFTSNSNNKVHDGCTTCHDGTTNALIGSAAGHENGPNVCTTCHTSRVWTDHNIDHQASGYVTLHSECTSCHSTTMTAGQGFINPADDEKHNGCTSCHAADGTQATGSGDCSMCHSGVTGDWTTHVQDHTAKVTSATGCASCHSATVDYASFVDGANNLKHDDCYVCHNAGTKLASATAGDCSQCHSGVVGDFTTHTTQDHTTKVTSAAGCTSCHSATVDYANFVDPANSLKHDNCTTCHDATTNAPTATAGDCSQCHSGVTGDFTTHTTQDHTTKVTLQTECSGCHSETVDYANFIDGANAKKHDACTTCHDATTNAPVTTAGDCSQCHTANYFDSHTHSHAVSYNASVDTSQTTQQGCATCHDDNSGALGSWADIYVEHLSDCANCHSYDGSASAPLNDVQNAISSGSPATCATCHTDKVPDVGHGGHDPADFGWSPSCSGCHNEAGNSDIVASPDVHNNECGLCHVNPGGGGTLRSYAVGKTISESTTCVTCHGTGPIEDMHHPNIHAQAGDCTWCHADPRPDWATTYSVTAPDPLPLQLACVKCHVEPSGTGLVVYRNTYTPTDVTGRPNGTTSWGVTGDASTQQTAVHTITGAAKINVYNYGACLGCHDGNTPGAPQIQVWHAAPTWNLADDSSSSMNDDAFDVLRNAPGRSYYANNNTPNGSSDTGANERRFNIFSTAANTGGMTKVRMYGRYTPGASSNKPYDGTSSQNRGKDMYRNYQNANSNPWLSNIATAPGMNRVTIPQIDAVNDPGNWMSSNPQVPYFDDIAAPAFPDNVQVQSAIYDGNDLIVTASNDDGCAELDLVYPSGGTNQGAFTGTTTCTKSIALADLSAGTDIDVVTTNVLGTDVSGYPIDDQSCIPITVSISGTPSWTPTAVGIGTLNAAATTSVGVAGVDMNGTAMAGGPTSWTLSQADVAYPASVTAVINDGTYCGTSAPVAVTNLGDNITVTLAEWTANTLTVNVTTTQNPASVTVDYGETGTILLPMSGVSNSWTLTSSQSYLPTIRVYSSSFGEVTNVSVENLDVTDLIVAGMANWTPGSAGGGTTITDDLNTGYTDQTIAGALNGWTAINNSDAINCWTFDSNGGNSSGTGPTADNPGGGQYVYLETSSAPGCIAGSQNWIESDVMDASTSDWTVQFDWHMNVELNTDAVLSMVVWNGSTWFNEATIQTGNNGDTWVTFGPYDLSAYNNADMQVRIQYLVGANGATSGSASYRNDVAFDNLEIVESVTPGPATLDILAANTEGATGGNVVHADYNGQIYDLVNIGGNRWQLTGATDAYDTYVNSITIYSDGDLAGLTYPVINNGGSLSWDSITVTTADWDGTDAVITATNTWGDQADMYADYNGSGPTLMTNTGGNNWVITFSSVPYAANVTVSNEAATNTPQVQAVTDLTAGSWVSNTYYQNQAYSGSLEGYTDGWTTCGVDPAVGSTIAMSDAVSAVDCSNDRADMTSGSSGDLMLRFVATTPYTAITPVNGVEVEGRLRDYANSGSAATRYALGCLNGTTFTPFGTVDEFRDTSTATNWITDLSSLTGTCNAGDSLALYVYRMGTGQYRFYSSTSGGGSMRLDVEEFK